MSRTLPYPTVSYRSPGVRVIVVLVLSALALGPFAGTSSASELAGAERDLGNSINAERRAAGLAPLRLDVELRRVARAWAAVMAREGRLYHNPHLAAQVQRDWLRLDENVGWASWEGASESELVDYVVTMFMESPDHRANVLRPEVDWVGVGLQRTDTTLWAAVIFMKAAPQSEHTGFRDISGGVHAPAITAMARRGVTQGCAPDLFCPHRKVTRAQMATFIARARTVPASFDTHFTDTAGSPHHNAINALASAGIIAGCGQGRFCPNAPVSRGQMASFLQRAWGMPRAGSFQGFSDVGATSVHRDAINAIADAGITQGCANGRYCPNQAVRRAEMASFIIRALTRD